MTPVQVLERFRQFNRSQSGMMAFTDWCEEKGIKVPCIEKIPERDQFDPQWVELTVELWAQCSVQQTNGKIYFDFPNYPYLAVILIEKRMPDKSIFKHSYAFSPSETHSPVQEVEFAIKLFNSSLQGTLERTDPATDPRVGTR